MLRANGRMELRAIETICRNNGVDYRTHFKCDREGFIDPAYTEIHFNSISDEEMVMKEYNKTA